MKQTFAWLGALLLVASLLALQPAGQVGPWVDLLRGWDSSAGHGNHYLQVRLPTSNPRRPLLATVTRTVGGCGSLATRQWILVVAQPAHDLPDGPARISWVHWERWRRPGPEVRPEESGAGRPRVRHAGGTLRGRSAASRNRASSTGSTVAATRSSLPVTRIRSKSGTHPPAGLGQPWRRSDRSGS